MMKYLVKHSVRAFRGTCWFLDEVYDFYHFELCISNTVLEFLKVIKCARLIKGYDSKEKLIIDADLMFGEYEMKRVD